MKVRVLIPILVVAGFGGTSAVAADSERCLHFRDLEAFAKVDDTTFTVRPKNSYDGKAYEIKFTGRCDYDRYYGNFFVTKDSSPWECLERGDHLRLSLGGTCVVWDIKPIAERISH